MQVGFSHQRPQPAPPSDTASTVANPPPLAAPSPASARPSVFLHSLPPLPPGIVHQLPPYPPPPDGSGSPALDTAMRKADNPPSGENCDACDCEACRTAGINTHHGEGGSDPGSACAMDGDQVLGCADENNNFPEITIYLPAGDEEGDGTGRGTPADTGYADRGSGSGSSRGAGNAASGSGTGSGNGPDGNGGGTGGPHPAGGPGGGSHAGPANGSAAANGGHGNGASGHTAGNPGTGGGTVYDFDPTGTWHPNMPQPGRGVVDRPIAFVIPPPVLPPPPLIPPAGAGGGTPGYDPVTDRPTGAPGYPAHPPRPTSDGKLPRPAIVNVTEPIIFIGLDPSEDDDEPIFRTPSQILADNLVNSGVPRPPDTAAHHIVAHGDYRMRRIRELLSRLGIDINSAENGVFLPNKPGSTAPGAYHPSLHSSEYYNAVEQEFDGIESREEAIFVLNRIRRRLINGTFPGSKPVPPTTQQ